MARDIPYAELMPLKMFFHFMACETVASLEERMQECIDQEYYEGAAVIQRLLTERAGKLEIRVDNAPRYFDIALPPK